MGWQDGTVVAQGEANAAELPVPAWQRAPAVAEERPAASTVTGALRQHFQSVQARKAESFTDYINAGFQQSVVGLAKRGEAPDVALGQDTPWYGRATASVAGLVGDAPAMIAGFAGGAPVGGIVGGTLTAGRGAAGGAVIGGFAGANALPAALRTVMMDAYTKGEVTSAAEFLERALHVAWETTKAGVVGAATGGAGIAAKAALPVAAPAITQVVAPTAAQLTTMVTTQRALEGELPQLQDFADGAVLLFGLQAAGAGAARLRTIYAKTGKTPAEVVADANDDPALKSELVASVEKPVATTAETVPSGQLELPGIPKAYQAIAQEETARSIVPGDKAAAVAASPFAEIPQIAGEPAKPTHVNYDLINSTDDAKLAMSRLSQVYEDEIQTQRRGTVSWDETSNEAAAFLRGAVGDTTNALVMPREPGTPAGAAELLARKQMVVGAAESMMAARDELLAKGAAASPDDHAQFLMSIERAALIQSEFLGARAEAGRALNILKSTAVEADRMKLVQQVIDQYGKNPMQLAEMLKSIDTVEGAAKFAREAVKATTWEKLVEGWKAAILSGPVTHMANIMGNGTFAVLRASIDAAAALIGTMHGASVGERVAAVEPVARIIGLLEGAKDGLRVGYHAFMAGESSVKGEQFRTAIEGVKGEVIRLPFRALQAEDAVFKTMNERAEAYTLATRQAVSEGLSPLTGEFRERVAELVNNLPDDIKAQVDAASTRFTFNEALGEKGQAVQNLVRKGHLEWAVPFIRTPANVAKELLRMTPFAPAIGEWRAAIQEGGVARDKALAEIAVGTATMGVVMSYAFDGTITGNGDPDPGKRRSQLAAGWQPYSIKVGDKYYSYQRLQPFGTLIGLAADMANVWDQMTDEESDKTPKMLSVAFANAITNQTFLQGITNVVQVLADPQRYGPKFVQQMAGSVVPGIVAQTTQMADPLAREVDSMLDAVKSRLPGFRQSLLPKRDIFGEPIANTERVAGVLPITVREESEDKVRTEAARIGYSAADTPKKTHIGRGTGKLGDVKLEPEERDVFAETGGKMAHELLQPLVNDPDWDALPDVVKLKTYQKVFAAAHKAAAYQALPLEKRADLMGEIIEKMTRSLEPEAATQ